MVILQDIKIQQYLEIVYAQTTFCPKKGDNKK